MKINDANVGGTGAAPATNGVGGSAAAKAQLKVGVGNTSTDEVQLSNLSEQIRAEDSSSPERAAHLQKLSAAIEAGTYRVDATAVGRKIIDESTKLP
jgi:flagellar biosynthesis anti-sigma factor FlgM